MHNFNGNGNGNGRHSLSITNVIDPVIQSYFPDLVQAVHAMLAMFGTMSVEGRNSPMALIFEGPSGIGKSTVLRMAMPDDEDEEYKKFIYRSDKFSPKSFVSHAMNIGSKKLADLDLLPKLENKMLVSKELAPLFRGRHEEMQENFSTLIAVLDGDGFTSDTGARGQRGYARKIVFNWIGATTPLPASTHQLMSQLGTRLMFYEMDSEMPNEDALVRQLGSDDSLYHQSICTQAIRDYLLTYFSIKPINSIPLEKLIIPVPYLRTIARWTRFLCWVRAEPKWEAIKGRDKVIVGREKPEGPHRVMNFFKLLVVGHALMCERMEVNSEDIEILEAVGMSSVPGHLRPIVKAMRVNGGKIKTEQAARAAICSEVTARGYMNELKHLEVAEVISEKPLLLSFLPEYKWLIQH